MDWIQFVVFIGSVATCYWVFSRDIKADMIKIDNRHREDMKVHREDMIRLDTKWETRFLAIDEKWEARFLAIDEKWERLFERLLTQDNEKPIRQRR